MLSGIATSAITATERYVGHAMRDVDSPSLRGQERNGQPRGPKSKLRLRRMMRRTNQNTMLAHAARTIHFDAMPMPSTTPRATSDSIAVINERLWMWTRKRKYANRMKKIGKMSIIPIRDWTKNMPSKHASVAAAMAKVRTGHRRLASRYIIGMHRVPNKAAAILQPTVL